MQPSNVLFLCTHNSCRSVIAECIMNQVGGGQFRGLSAGSSPSGKINADALVMLSALGYDTTGVRSKSWTNLPNLVHYLSTSSSRCAMKLPMKSVRCGLENRLALTGALQTRRGLLARRMLVNVHLKKRTKFCANVFWNLLRCRLALWMTRVCSKSYPHLG